MHLGYDRVIWSVIVQKDTNGLVTRARGKGMIYLPFLVSFESIRAAKVIIWDLLPLRVGYAGFVFRIMRRD